MVATGRGSPARSIHTRGCSTAATGQAGRHLQGRLPHAVDQEGAALSCLVGGHLHMDGARCLTVVSCGERES